MSGSLITLPTEIIIITSETHIPKTSNRPFSTLLTLSPLMDHSLPFLLNFFFLFRFFFFLTFLLFLRPLRTMCLFLLEFSVNLLKKLRRHLSYLRSYLSSKFLFRLRSNRLRWCLAKRISKIFFLFFNILQLSRRGRFLIRNLRRWLEF